MSFPLDPVGPRWLALLDAVAACWAVVALAAA
jgi:hypothetical protein